MIFHTRKWIRPENLNPNQSLFGGKLLQWIDEEAALYAITQLDSPNIVTKYISEINFVSSAKQGDVIEIGIEVIEFAHTYISLKCIVRNMMTRQIIITKDRIVLVAVDERGRPRKHAKSQVRNFDAEP